MSHIWMSHVMRVNESCHTYEWAMPHALIYVAWLMYACSHICDMTHTYMLPYMWHDSCLHAFIHVTWLMSTCIDTRDMTHVYMHSYMWHESYIYAFMHVTWIMHICSHICDIHISLRICNTHRHTHTQSTQPPTQPPTHLLCKITHMTAYLHESCHKYECIFTWVVSHI